MSAVAPLIKPLTNTIPNHTMAIIITVKFTDIDKNIAKLSSRLSSAGMGYPNSQKCATTQPTTQHNINHFFCDGIRIGNKPTTTPQYHRHTTGYNYI